MLVDPGPANTIDTGPRRAAPAAGRGRCCSPTSTSTTPARPGRWSSASPTSPSTSTRPAPRTSSIPRGCCAAPRASTAIAWTELWGEVLAGPGARTSSPLARRRGRRGPRGDRRARPRLPSRRLPRPRTPATRSSATSPGSGSRPATPSGCRRRLPTSTSSAGARRSRAVLERRPRRLLLTHYGVGRRARAASGRGGGRPRAARRGAREPGDRERFLTDLEARIDAEPPELAERTRSAMPPEQTWLGLERYWRRRAKA